MLMHPQPRQPQGGASHRVRVACLLSRPVGLFEPPAAGPQIAIKVQSLLTPREQRLSQVRGAVGRGYDRRGTAGPPIAGGRIEKPVRIPLPGTVAPVHNLSPSPYSPPPRSGMLWMHPSLTVLPAAETGLTPP